MQYKLHPDALELIMKFEVGGGKRYYDKFLSHPIWPGGSSGITIGIGYDLGMNEADDIIQDWAGLIPQHEVMRLSLCSGKIGSKGRAAALGLSDITVPWSAAMTVFNGSTVPRYWELTCGVFPGIEDAPLCVQGALFSLVYNRGTSLEGPRRQEMRNIKALVVSKDYAAIAHQLRAMADLWKGTDIEAGMRRRRDAEAELCERAA